MNIRSLKLACATLDPSRFPRTPWPEVAISGRSNVGKSSLLNTLFERKNFARISKDPGKTRSINFYSVNDRFSLVDLPGYGYAKVSAEMRRAWLHVIHSYLERRSTLAGVVQLIDSRHPPTKDDMTMIARLIENRRPFLVVFTKADKVPRTERQRAAREFRSHFESISAFVQSVRTGPREGSPPRTVDIEAIFFSARTGEGKEELWKWILQRVEEGHGKRDA